MVEFIVRIYRQGEFSQSSEEVFGVIERIGHSERRTFRSMQELWDLLATANEGGDGSARPPRY